MLFIMFKNKGGFNPINKILILTKKTTVVCYLLFFLFALISPGCEEPDKICTQSPMSPDTADPDLCLPGAEGNPVCIQNQDGAGLPTILGRGRDFNTGTVRIQVKWCPNRECNPSGNITSDPFLVVIDTEEGGEGAITRLVDCEMTQASWVFTGVTRITFGDPGRTSRCSRFPNSYLMWEVCDIELPPDSNEWLNWRVTRN